MATCELRNEKSLVYVDETLLGITLFDYISGMFPFPESHIKEESLSLPDFNNRTEKLRSETAHI